MIIQWDRVTRLLPTPNGYTMLLPITVLLCAHMYVCVRARMYVRVCVCMRTCVWRACMCVWTWCTRNTMLWLRIIFQYLGTTRNPLHSQRLYWQPRTLYTPRLYWQPRTLCTPNTLLTTRNPLHSQYFSDNLEPSALPILYWQPGTLYTPNTLLTTWNPLHSLYWQPGTLYTPNTLLTTRNPRHSQHFIDNPEPSTLPILYWQPGTLYTPNTLVTTWNPSTLPNKRGVVQVLLEIKESFTAVSPKKEKWQPVFSFFQQNTETFWLAEVFKWLAAQHPLSCPERSRTVRTAVETAIA